MRSFRIGSVFGIPLKLDLTFLLVLPLFAYLIGSQVDQTVEVINLLWDPDLATIGDGALPWIVGIVAAIGLFVGVVLHELGHSLTAMRFGYPIDSITLWIFGGIAQLSEMPEDWKQELYIAIAGPAVSIGVGVVSYLAFIAMPESLNAVRFVFGYLAVLNIALAAFNLLPGFPMDGGRVLRALLARTRPYAQATQIAAEVGKGFALLLGIFGLFRLDIIMIGIAFFIYIAASSEAQQVVMRAAFQGITAGDLMTPAEQLHTVEPGVSVAELMNRMFQERHTGYPVLRDGDVVGMVTLEDAKEIAPVERDAFTVEDVMSSDLVTIGVEADAMDALTALAQNDIGRLLVTNDAGEVVGLLSRSDLMTAFDIIKSSGRSSAVERVGGTETPSRLAGR